MLIEIRALSKHYGDFKALDACTFGVERGEVFGLLGPNGAGKTTLLRLLLGFQRPTSGEAVIDELDCHRQSLLVRQRVSYLPGEARLFRQMRGRDVLHFFADLRPGGDRRAAHGIAERLDLDLRRRVALMSTGMRQKLALAATLSADTPVLILDEPTNNLDPTVRSVVVQLVREAREAGRTVVFSSHILSEVEDSCDRVAILRAGKLVHTQIMAELHKQHRIQACLAGALPPLPDEIRPLVTVAAASEHEASFETSHELAPLLGWLATLPVTDLRIEPLGLKTIYQRYHANHTLRSTTS